MTIIQRVIAETATARLNPGALADLPLPTGITLDQTAALIAAIYRDTAVRHGLRDLDERPVWYHYTGKMLSALSEIDRRCSYDSKLHQYVMGRDGTRFMIRANVEETIATAQFDGVDIDYDAAKDLLLMRRRPKSASERIISNHFDILEQLPELADHPWSPELMQHMYAALTEGTRGGESGIGGKAKSERESRKTAMEAVCAFATQPNRDYYEHPVLAALTLRANIQYRLVFPSWNGMMSRLIFRLDALKRGYPVLGYLAFSKMERSHLRVEPAESKPDGQSMRFSAISGYESGYEGKGSDAAPWFEMELTSIMEALGEFEDNMRRAKDIDDAVRDQLSEDLSLNRRQRSVIARALRVPDARFYIAYHRTTHGIGYATAYRDFAELVSQGLLIQETRGHASEFWAVPDLKTRIKKSRS